MTRVVSKAFQSSLIIRSRQYGAVANSIMMNEINTDSLLPKMLNNNLYYKYIKLLLRRTYFVAKLVDTQKI